MELEIFYVWGCENLSSEIALIGLVFGSVGQANAGCLYSTYIVRGPLPDVGQANAGGSASLRLPD